MNISFPQIKFTHFFHSVQEEERLNIVKESIFIRMYIYWNP